jgi:hypothetical protein
MESESHDIIRRVLDAVPAGSYAINALLSLVRIDVSRKVPTAAVSCERRPVLFINPDFVEAHCRSDEHLFLLVMHELHHVLLGHTRLFPRPTPAHNLAFDAVINALLVARFPQQAYTSFFTNIYGAQESALRLLAPPGDPPIADPELQAIHTALYGSGDVTSQEVFAWLSRHSGCTRIDVTQLLGSHGDERDEWGTDSEANPDFIKIVRSIVEKWPPPDDPVHGRSLADLLAATRAQPASPQQRVLAVMRAALCGAASRPGPKRAVGIARQRVDTPVPDLRDRRAAVIRGLGRPALLNVGEIAVTRRGRGRADVYLDVSGSVDTMLPALYGALRTLRAWVAPDVHLFSTGIATVSLDRLCAGQVQTTGGTDLACVLAHIAERRPKKALVITDGYVGSASPALITRASTACRDIRVLLTPQGWRQDLGPIASRIDELPPLEGL